MASLSDGVLGCAARGSVRVAVLGGAVLCGLGGVGGAASGNGPFIVVAPDQESEPVDLGPGVRVLGLGAAPGGGLATQELQSFFAFDPAFSGGVRVATGDVNNDGTPDIITGAGPGGGPHVRVFDGRTGSSEFDLPFAFDNEPGFTGGVFVASGDLNGDGRADIITGAGAGGGPHVKVFSGSDGSELRSFFAYDPGFTGGVFVASGDVNGDGFEDIITGPGPGQDPANPGGFAPPVRVFDGVDASLITEFFAYDQGFLGGVHVSTDANFVNNPTGIAIDTEIITSPASQSAGVPVRFFGGVESQPDDFQFGQLPFGEEFFPYGTGFNGGVRVAGVDLIDEGFGFNEILTIPGPGTGAEVRVFAFSTDPPFPHLDSFFAFEAFTGGVFVGGSGAGLDPLQSFEGGGFIAAGVVVPEPCSVLLAVAGLVFGIGGRGRGRG